MLHTTWTNTANIATRLGEPRSVTAKDGVHFITNSYMNLADRVFTCLHTMLTATPRIKKECTRYWRGFKSPVGAPNAHSQQSRTQHAASAHRLHITPGVETAVHIAIAGPSFRTGVGPGRVSTHTAETRTALSCLLEIFVSFMILWQKN